MKNSPEILNELMTISPLLAGIDKVNVLQVPEGYFNELHLRITDFAILNNTSPGENVIKRNIRDVPEGYFETLSDSILAKIKTTYPESAEEELNRIAPNLKNLNKNIFTVPQGYFETLSDLVLTNAKGLNYKTAEEELRSLSTTLYALKHKNVFTVPEGYFEALAGNVSKKLNAAPPKIVPIRRSTWLQYAAAAVITGIIAIASLQIFNNHHNNNSGMASLPDYVKASLKYKTAEDLNSGIAKLSDADIIKYLEKNGNVTDNELLINNTDMSAMPSATDYLSDENTLNEYLDKINAQNVSKSTP